MMYNNDQIQQLYQYIQYQQKKISQFEKTIETLQSDIQTIKEQPPINVERIEYKFDQLKIEHLDGTLSIGINPTDLKNAIDELEIPNQPNQSAQESFLHQPQFKENLKARLDQYVSKNLNAVIQDTEVQLGTKLDQNYIDFIINDIHNQIPQKVDYYVNLLANQNLGNISKDELLNQAFLKMKADIDQAVFMFVSKLPNNMNGEDTNGA